MDGSARFKARIITYQAKGCGQRRYTIFRVIVCGKAEVVVVWVRGKGEG